MQSVNVDIAFLVFAAASLLAFRMWRPAVAVLIVFLGGWILLPVGRYPAASLAAPFPYWIIGLALPSDLLVTKAWIAPVVALAGAALFDRPALRSFRAHWLDLPVVLWCAWPLLASVFVAELRPSPPLAAAYLTGCWAAPWLLGRLYFATADGQRLLAKGLAVSALACLPFSVIEGIGGPHVYGWLYGPHPFRFDGDARYVGFRPIGFFEHGNQFGLWMSLCALAATWLAVTAPIGGRGRWRAIALGLVVLAVAAQSVGAIVLLAVGVLVLATRGRAWLRRVAAMALLAFAAAGAVYLSGAVPITYIAKETSVGRRVVDTLRSAGRGSFAWRISQDQKLLGEAMRSPATGSQQWDWWRAKDIRPWGLPLLVIGQLGLVGLCLLLATLLGPVAAAARWPPRGSGLQLLMASLVVLSLVDALMNSFIFFPAIVAAAAIAGPATRRREGFETTRFDELARVENAITAVSSTARPET